MNIGIDIDNVLSNFNEELLKEFMAHDKELRNLGIVNDDAYITTGMFDWSKEEFDDFYYNNIERIAKNLKVIDKAPEYIKRLREKGHKIYIITGRDNGEYSNPYKMTKDWLKKYDIQYDKLILSNIFDSYEKAKICLENNINIMVDDSSRIQLEINKTRVTALLMDTPYNRKIDSLIRVHNWREIYEFIINFKRKKINLILDSSN